MPPHPDFPLDSAAYDSSRANGRDHESVADLTLRRRNRLEEDSVFVMRESDTAAIHGLMGKFLRAVSFEHGQQPSYGDLANLFIPGARLIRNSGASPEISTVEEFVRSRQDAVDSGELTSFEETELRETTELFGNIAHRFSPYAKRGMTRGGPIDVKGAISTQFIRTPEGWRISSMAWDDERPGLELPRG
jgi:hypothetical protein